MKKTRILPKVYGVTPTIVLRHNIFKARYVTNKITATQYSYVLFPFTLTRTAKRWVGRLTPGAVNTWDLLKKAFIQRYCPPSKTAKRLEDIHNFKQKIDESLYQAWEWFNDLLYKCLTHNINNHQKVNIFYKGLSTINRQLLDLHELILWMTPTQALTVIQTMADHSQKWHDGTLSKNLSSSSSNTDELAGIVSKLDNLERDMKKLKEIVHAIQVGCQICKGPHLDKEYTLNKEAKQVGEAKYKEFGRPAPFNRNNEANYRVGTDEDDKDLEGIIDYLQPTLYDGFIDLDDEEYKERKSQQLGGNSRDRLEA
nr:hypothetical protein [Tanacetum cinerariifolium]